MGDTRGWEKVKNSCTYIHLITLTVARATSEHRPSKAKRALESTGLPVLKQRPRPSAAFNLSSWPAEEELETLVCDPAQL